MGRRLDLTLTEKERQALEGLVRKERDVRIVKRAQTLLWLSAGEQVQEVAGRLQVTPQTIRNWVKRYQGRKKHGRTIGSDPLAPGILPLESTLSVPPYTYTVIGGQYTSLPV